LLLIYHTSGSINNPVGEIDLNAYLATIYIRKSRIPRGRTRTIRPLAGFFQESKRITDFSVRKNGVPTNTVVDTGCVAEAETA
jgi:hypothetical protein